MRLFLPICILAIEKTTIVHASIYVSALFQEYVFPSVNYFDVRETKWPKFDQVLNGRVVVLPSLNLDESFPETGDKENATDGSHGPFYPVHDDWVLERMKEAPKFLVVDFQSAPSFEEAMYNTSLAASKVGADFVVVVVGSHVSWQQQFLFWWSHQFPGSPTGDLLPTGNATHPHFYIAVGPRQGQEIIQLIKQETHYLGNYSSEEFFFGIDNFDDFEGRDLVVRCVSYIFLVLSLSQWIRNNDPSSGNRRSNHTSSTRNHYTGEDLSMGEIQASSAGQDCPVCLETMQPGEMVRILPCRHALHHDCITGWFQQGKYSCPLCKMDFSQYLEEQRTATREIIRGSRQHRRHRWFWPWGRRTIQNMDAENQLLADRNTTIIAEGSDSDDLGDLELTSDLPTIT